MTLYTRLKNLKKDTSSKFSSVFAKLVTSVPQRRHGAKHCVSCGRSTGTSLPIHDLALRILFRATPAAFEALICTWVSNFPVEVKFTPKYEYSETPGIFTFPTTMQPFVCNSGVSGFHSSARRPHLPYSSRGISSLFLASTILSWAASLLGKSCTCV